MKRLFEWALAGAVLLSSATPGVFAGSCESGDGCGGEGFGCSTKLESLFGSCDSGIDFGCGEGCGAGGLSGSGIKIGGRLQMGYHSEAVGLAAPGVGGAAFNQRPHEVQLH